MLSISLPAGGATGDIHKRRAARQRIETLAYADLGPGNGGFPLNISEMGMAVQGIQPLEKDQVICIKFKLPGMKEVVETSGRIIWLNDLGKGGGLEFINLGEESCRLINRWLSLQTHTENQVERVTATHREVKEKEIRLFSAPPAAARDGMKGIKSDLELMSLLSPASPLTFTDGPTTGNKLAADILRTKEKTKSEVLGSRSKRAWIVPFTIGLLTSVAIMVGALIIFGVISIQFHWPQQMADASLARPVTETSSVKTVKSPTKKISRDDQSSKGVISGLSASIQPSTTNSSSPIAEPPASQVTAPEPIRTRTNSTPKAESPKVPIQEAITSKAMAPGAARPARILDSAPPVITPPTAPGLVPQLSMASPVPPGSTLPALETSKLEAAVLIKRKDPIYSAVARERGISGVVELHFTITVEGNVRGVSVVKGNPLLVHAALEAVQMWHYQPARHNGFPIEAESSAVFNFIPN